MQDLTGNGHENALVDAFVNRHKRARLKALLQSPRTRPKALATLYHFRDLDRSHLVPIDPSAQTSELIARRLRRYGATTQCYVISTDATLDGRYVNLAAVLDQIVGSGEAALVSCIPGVLAYYEGEEKHDRYILRVRA